MQHAQAAIAAATACVQCIELFAQATMFVVDVCLCLDEWFVMQWQTWLDYSIR